MSSEHLPVHVIDKLTAGVLSPAETDAAGAHAAACSDCAAKVAAAAKERGDFLARNPPALRAEAMLDGSKRRPWLRWLVPALALAAAAVVVVNLPRGPDVIEKGPGAGVTLWVQRGDRTWTPAADEPLEPGDRVQLKVTSGSGDVTVYGTGHVKLFTQHVDGPTALDQSFVLDAAPGDETLTVELPGGTTQVFRIHKNWKK